MAKIGIGIVTYNRLEYLKRVVEAVRKHTKAEYQLVVAEDGGADGSKQWCEAEGITVVSGPNGGVCWNKNRALFALEALGCDPILLLEDDCLPVQDGWEEDWRIATAIHGHLAYAHPKLTPWLISGSGTPTDPIVNYKATAQCSSVSGEGLRDVGFFDTRFKGYGVGHAEWTTRLKRAGYGYKRAIDALGRKVKANLYITGGLTADDAPTFKDKANIKRNEALFDALKSEPLYRHPWSDDEERTRFLAEMRASGIGEIRYDKIMEDMEADYPRLGLRHLRAYGRVFRRAFGDPKSFLKTSGWLSSMALNIPVYEGELTPWFNYTVIELLKERVRPEWRVFEYGAGYSTIWWSAHVAEVVSIENDAGWVARVAQLCEGRRVDLRAVPADEAFAPRIGEYEGAFDVIVVDGHDRPACVRQALPRLAPGGVLMLDNSNRREYAEAIEWVEARGFKRLSLKGPAPMTHQMETTSFFYRPDNVMGL